MAGTIWEFFGYRFNDKSSTARQAEQDKQCPIIKDKCEKTFNDGVVSGVCTIKPMTTNPVICCPIRLYANNYKILYDISLKAFEENFDLIPGHDAVSFAKINEKSCIAVFGKRWGGELRLPQKSGGVVIS